LFVPRKERRADGAAVQGRKSEVREGKEKKVGERGSEGEGGGEMEKCASPAPSDKPFVFVRYIRSACTEAKRTVCALLHHKKQSIPYQMTTMTREHNQKPNKR
jgi:hypothetical protein